MSLKSVIRGGENNGFLGCTSWLWGNCFSGVYCVFSAHYHALRCGHAIRLPGLAGLGLCPAPVGCHPGHLHVLAHQSGPLRYCLALLLCRYWSREQHCQVNGIKKIKLLRNQRAAAPGEALFLFKKSHLSLNTLFANT